MSFVCLAPPHSFSIPLAHSLRAVRENCEWMKFVFLVANSHSSISRIRRRRRRQFSKYFSVYTNNFRELHIENRCRCCLLHTQRDTRNTHLNTWNVLPHFVITTIACFRQWLAPSLFHYDDYYYFSTFHRNDANAKIRWCVQPISQHSFSNFAGKFSSRCRPFISEFSFDRYNERRRQHHRTISERRGRKQKREISDR